MKEDRWKKIKFIIAQDKKEGSGVLEGVETFVREHLGGLKSGDTLVLERKDTRNDQIRIKATLMRKKED